MGLNVANRQIAHELGLNEGDAQRMAEQLRQGVVTAQPEPVLSGQTVRRAVECDEVYGLRGRRSQGPPRRGEKKGRRGRRRRLKGARGRGTLETEKPPILGLIERGGQVVMRMLANVQQQTIEPLIKATIRPGSCVHTDEYAIYGRLPQWGYVHRTVCHSAGEYARRGWRRVP